MSTGRQRFRKDFYLADDKMTVFQSGRTALHLAVNNRDTAMVTFLLECNANVNCLDCDGRTPIMLACIVGHLPAVELLLRAGAELDVRDEDEDARGSFQ
ncbi:ankyrin repeat protein [Opisthorchis viverrini]|uniref:Ankyrin repeat protein n=1 Tax=Opisthorchis viverrini TaxID=6198 RepID=A0A1S8X9L1_OPIVI|nr:ankyrin repeat protein [Opisthorchis viverrini]